MKKDIYKIFNLEEVLDLYINNNGVSQLINHSYSKESSNIDFSFDDQTIDLQIKKDFIEDIYFLENETEEKIIERVKRYQKIVRMLKQKYGYKCQLCGYSFEMDNGVYYCEAHHFKALADNGPQSPENVIIVCANHHRMFHYATNTIFIGELVNGKRIIKIGKDEYLVQFL